MHENSKASYSENISPHCDLCYENKETKLVPFSLLLNIIDGMDPIKVLFIGQYFSEKF